MALIRPHLSGITREDQYRVLSSGFFLIPVESHKGKTPSQRPKLREWTRGPDQKLCHDHAPQRHSRGGNRPNNQD